MNIKICRRRDTEFETKTIFCEQSLLAEHVEVIKTYTTTNLPRLKCLILVIKIMMISSSMSELTLFTPESE